MIKIVGVRFRNAGKVYYFDPMEFTLRIGDHVIINKAAEIIPEVLRVVPEKRTGEEKVFHMPETCPECGWKVERKEGEAAWRSLTGFPLAEETVTL